MTAALEIPSGTVPPLPFFTRHLWRYQNEHGQSALMAPPGPICSFRFHDPNDANCALSVAHTINNLAGLNPPISIQFGEAVTINFLNVGVLHAFVKMLTLHPTLESYRRVAHACMTQLGFVWR